MDRTPPRRSVLTGIVCLGVLAAVVTGIMIAMRPPAPAGMDAPAGEFSAARAMIHLQRVAATPHPVGSAEHDAVRDYLVGELRRLGLQVRLDEGTSANTRLGAPFPVARVSTIIAVLPGSSGAGAVYLDAHYDSVRNGAGENDDSVAVAALLETARALSQGAKLPNDVVFVFSDGEEPGMLGARHLVGSVSPADRPAVVLNFEARGASGPVVMFETAEANSGLLDAFADAPLPLGFSLSYEVYRRLPNDTNFTEWRDAGFTGLNFAYLDRSPYYDSSGDAIEHVNQRALQHDGELALRLSSALGDTDLTRLDRGGDTYFWLPGVMVRYPNGLAVPLAVLAVLLLAALIVLARRRGVLRLRSYAWAVLSVPLPLVAGAVLAIGCWLGAAKARPEYAALVLGDTYRPGWMRAGLVVLAITVGFGWYAMLRRRLGGLALALAGLTLLAVLGVAVTVAAPGAGYLFSLPVLVWAIAGLVLLARPEWIGSWPVAVLVGAVGAAAVGVPIVALLFPALGIANGAIPVLLVVLLSLPAMPLTELFVPRRRAITAGVAAAAALAMFAAGVALDGPDAAHPTPTSLVYVLDADTGSARWLSADATPNEWTRGYVHDERQGMEASMPMLTGVFISSYLTGPAQVAPLVAPEVSVVQTQVVGETRTVRLHVASPRRAPVLWFHVAADAPAITAAVVDGRDVGGAAEPAVAGGHWGWGFGFHGLPAGGIDVTLTFAGTRPVELRVADQSDGLDGLPGFTPMPVTMETSVLPSNAVYVARTIRI